MSQNNTIDLSLYGDFNAKHAASIEYFNQVLDRVESELAVLSELKNVDAAKAKRIAKLKEIQKNTKHNLELTIMYTKTRRPYGL